MGWFDEQIKLRKKTEDEQFSKSAAFLNEAGTRKLTRAFADVKEVEEEALATIFRYFGISKQNKILYDISQFFMF